MKQINFSDSLRFNTFAKGMKKGISLLVFCLLFACNVSQHSTILDASAFSEKINEQNIQILDVRTSEEYNAGHIKGALNMDVQSDNFDFMAGNLYKDIPVYVYCLKGGRSNDAAKRLKELGFKEIYDLKGGYEAWVEKGLPVQKIEPAKLYANDTIPFDVAIKGDKLVLVDFNATWCKPCLLLQPVIDRIHNERTEDVIVYSIDVDKFPDIARKYDASQIPLLLMFKNNEIVHRSIGVMDEAELNGIIDKKK